VYGSHNGFSGHSLNHITVTLTVAAQLRAHGGCSTSSSGLLLLAVAGEEAYLPPIRERTPTVIAQLWLHCWFSLV
jgi:hypothetical protein